MVHTLAAEGLTVAIIGVGPKGLFALERLVDAARRAGPEARIHVDLYEPHAWPGAGPVYAPDQPDFLRMNIAATRLDLAPGGGDHVGHEDFMTWRRDAHPDDVGAEGHHGGEVGEGPRGTIHHDQRWQYPPRSLVGRYLADAFRLVCASAPEWVSITLRPHRVRTLSLVIGQAGPQWRITTAGPRPAVHAEDLRARVDDARVDHADEVLLTTGHETRSDWPALTWAHSAPLIPAVFPVADMLGPDGVPSGCTVAVRGFALTFIDAALALTEGRGGRFVSTGHPWRLRYVPSSHDVGQIVPFARTGRPLLAKAPPMGTGIDDGQQVVSAWQSHVRSLAGRTDPLAGLIDVLALASDACLDPTGGNTTVGRQYDVGTRWLTEACDGAPIPTDQTVMEEISTSIDAALGLRAPDLVWAMGHVWRTLYPAIVDTFSHDGLSSDQWPRFRQLAVQMERVAFGPPAMNAAKLLALIEAGRVSLDHVSGGQLANYHGRTVVQGGHRPTPVSPSASPHARTPVDVVVNAVLPAAGASGSRPGPLRDLLVAGHVRTMAGRRGLEVRSDCGCVSEDGQVTPGLSAFGRPTEDCVIGNDTLNRALHDHPARWAQKVTARATGSAPVATALIAAPRAIELT